MWYKQRKRTRTFHVFETKTAYLHDYRNFSSEYFVYMHIHCPQFSQQPNKSTKAGKKEAFTLSKIESSIHANIYCHHFSQQTNKPTKKITIGKKKNHLIHQKLKKKQRIYMSIDIVIERFTTFHLSKTKTTYLHNYQNLNFLEFFRQPNKAINHKKLQK